jgi:hypothetical protein
MKNRHFTNGGDSKSRSSSLRWALKIWPGAERPQVDV